MWGLLSGSSTPTRLPSVACPAASCASSAGQPCALALVKSLRPQLDGSELWWSTAANRGAGRRLS